MIRTTPQQHQIEGAQFLVKKKYAICAAKTGKGKTLISLACIHYHVHGKQDYALVFAPVKAYDNVWEQEIKKHTDMMFLRLPQAFDIWKKRKSLDFLFDYDILLVKYTDVKEEYFQFLQEACKNRIACFDEIHKLKTPDTKLTRLLTYITREVRTKWGMTATSIGNSILDLWGVMHFLEPRLFGTEWDFKRKYCIMEDKVIGKKGRMLQTVKEVVGYKNLDELKEILKNILWSVESDMKVNFHEIKYTITEYEEDVYLIAAKGILGETLKGFAQRMPDIQRVVDGSRDKDGTLQTTFRGSKYKEYLKEILRILSMNESVIVFTEYLDTFDMMSALLKEDALGVPIYHISGAGVENATKFPCIVLATTSGSESLNLKFANHVLFYSVPFSVAAFIQTVGRITRMDSDHKENLHVYLPYCDSTIDLYKNKYLSVNADLIEEVLGRDMNLPEKKLEIVRRSMLGELRKDLLWRVKGRKKNLTGEQQTMLII